ncbi:hypothetical protein THAOC_22448, partial [Thalassiosira oceanica]
MDRVLGEGCGVADLSDCLACAAYLESGEAAEMEPRLDLSRGVAVGGQSWGGYLAFMCMLEKRPDGRSVFASPRRTSRTGSSSSAAPRCGTTQPYSTTTPSWGGGVRGGGVVEGAESVANVEGGRPPRPDPSPARRGGRRRPLPADPPVSGGHEAEPAPDPGASVEFHAYKGEDHGMSGAEAQADYLDRVKTFLRINLKPWDFTDNPHGESFRPLGAASLGPGHGGPRTLPVRQVGSITIERGNSNHAKRHQCLSSSSLSSLSLFDLDMAGQGTVVPRFCGRGTPPRCSSSTGAAMVVTTLRAVISSTTGSGGTLDVGRARVGGVRRVAPGVGGASGPAADRRRDLRAKFSSRWTAAARDGSASAGDGPSSAADEAADDEAARRNRFRAPGASGPGAPGGAPRRVVRHSEVVGRELGQLAPRGGLAARDPRRGEQGLPLPPPPPLLLLLLLPPLPLGPDPGVSHAGRAHDPLGGDPLVHPPVQRAVVDVVPEPLVRVAVLQVREHRGTVDDVAEVDAVPVVVVGVAREPVQHAAVVAAAVPQLGRALHVTDLDDAPPGEG